MTSQELMHFTAATHAEEETLTGVLARYEKQGFKGQFSARPGGQLLCLSCQHRADARQVRLLALHRLEGVSDPGDMSAVAALECPNCGVRGTLALAFGSSASPEEHTVLRRFIDERGATGIHPGV
jgi:hypothetical protein